MKKKTANQKHHFNTASTDERHNLLKSLVEGKVIVGVWAKGQTEDDLEEFMPIKTELNKSILYIKKHGGFLTKFTNSKLAGKEVFFRAILGKMQYFTYTKLSFDAESDTYSLSLLNDLFRGQQRSNYRLEANRLVVVKFRLSTTVFDCLDISAGGTSFFVDESELKKYPIGETFTGNKLAFQRVHYEIPECKIAGHWPQKDIEGKLTGEVKVGISFSSMSKETEERLFKEINSVARAEEIRLRVK